MLDKLPSLSETVQKYGLGTNKKLGQHFLLDMNITDKIARLARPLEDCHVAEIGPGPGGLTRSLLKSGAGAVTVIEMDERFLPALKDIADVSDGRLNIIKGDALKVHINKELSGASSIKIAANLPYNVGTKMLLNWLTADPLFWDQAVLMFQKEVALRIVASPGDSNYGRLAVLAQSVCVCQMAFEVPASCFSPPPKVDSAVVVLTPLSMDQRFSNLKRLGEVTQAAFGQRRKMLRKSLKSVAGKYGLDLTVWLEACEINPTDRPEDLAVTDFQTLALYSLVSDQQSAP